MHNFSLKWHHDLPVDEDDQLKEDKTKDKDKDKNKEEEEDKGSDYARNQMITKVMSRMDINVRMLILWIVSYLVNLLSATNYQGFKGESWVKWKGITCTV